MDFLHALVLGALQGLTEVLPISSSAHLILLPHFLGWEASGLTFDVALHVGTLLALLVYFRNDIAKLVSDLVAGIREQSFALPQRRLPLYIIAGCIPAAIVGKTLEEPIDAIFRSNLVLIALLLIGFGLALALSDHLGEKKKEIAEITLSTALLIGLAQSLALFPGVSRSGVTITAALFLGFSRSASARFSFLLSLPIVAGAGILKLWEMARKGVPAGELEVLIAGVATSALFGYLSVAFLLSYVQRYSLLPFVWYRVLVGVAALVFLL